MNLNPRSIPGLRSLYQRDLTIKKAANTAGFGIMVGVGMLWASQTVTPSPVISPEERAFNASTAHWAIVGGFVLAVLAVIVLAWRYRTVKKILTNGSIITGTVEDLEVYSHRTNSDSSTSRPSYSRSYYATVRYAIHGTEKTVCLKIPNSGYTFGLVKGRETELIVLDELPNKPLIRSVYLPAN